jgi:parvulin-like peptidyl-prolyl isomerase
MCRSRTLILALILALAATIAATLSACGGDAAGSPAASRSGSPSADPVELLVDGRPVLKSTLEAVRAEFRLGGASDARARAEEEAVRRELLRHEAERLGVTADPAEVQSRRDAMVQQAGGEEAFAQALQAVPITDAELRSGLTDGVLHEALQDARFGDVAATDGEARAYYDRHRKAFRQEGSVHLYAITVAAEPIARNALQRLREGHPFAEVARQFTTDAEAKANSGDLGVVALASLPAPFTKALEAGKPGAVVGPVQGPGGWYLLKAEDLQKSRVAPFAEVRASIVKELTRRDRFRALENWLDAARERASVTRP